jgi:malate dehydrogenase
MAKAILTDEKRVLPCSVYLTGQYGQEGVYAGVPVKLGLGGAEEVIEIKLSQEEQAAFDKSAEAVRKGQAATGY